MHPVQVYTRASPHVYGICTWACGAGELGRAARAALLGGLLRRGVFSNWRWAAHRLLWSLALRSPLVAALLSLADTLPALCHPLEALRCMRERRAAAAADDAAAHASGHRSRGRRRTLGETLTARQGEQIGHALAAHAVLFSWRAGDVLLLDNARVLHDGMPGFGPRRRLWVALLADDADGKASASTVVAT